MAVWSEYSLVAAKDYVMVVQTESQGVVWTVVLLVYSLVDMMVVMWDMKMAV